MRGFQSLEYPSIRHRKCLAQIAVALTGDEPTQCLMAHGPQSLPNALLDLMDGLSVTRGVVDILIQFPSPARPIRICGPPTNVRSWQWPPCVGKTSLFKHDILP